MSKRIVTAILALVWCVTAAAAPVGAALQRTALQYMQAEVSQPQYAPDEPVTFIVEVEGEPVLAAEEAALMGARSYMQTDVARQAETEILHSHSRILSDMQKKVDKTLKIGYTYTTLFNGFSVDGKYQDMEKMQELAGVKAVYISETYAIDLPRMGHAPGLTAAPYAYDTMGYNGEGQVVAILDSEFDTNHPFFAAAPVNPKYDAEDIQNIIKAGGMNVSADAAVYKSAKIPFAYDYYFGVADTFNDDPNFVHGTHVAGIVGGKDGMMPDSTPMSGVAPEAQLILMKVSNASGSIPSATVFAALNDAAKLGVSAVNMSFGSDYVAGALQPAYDKQTETARAAGIFISVAAGNASRGYYEKTPLVENIDYSAAGIPNSFSQTTAVASAYNQTVVTPVGQMQTADGETVPYQEAYTGSDFYGAMAGQTHTYVYCGLGKAEDFANVDVQGKIAFIRRGDNTFTEKVDGAQDAGAVAVILWNTDDMVLTTNALSLPTAVVTDTVGKILLDAPAKTFKVKAPIDSTVDLPTGGQMATSSSWGITDELELKPEITAPGGYIYSSVPNGEYQYMSGTSMAAPHITGLVALMNQYYESDPFISAYDDLGGAEKVLLIENLMMSTANVLMQATDVPASPRVQGAGMADIRGAMTTPVILIGNGEKAKISLGEELENEIILQFTAKNLTDTEQVYTIADIDVLTDDYITQDGKHYVGDMRTLQYTTTAIGQHVTVPAGGEVTIGVTVELDAEELQKNAEIFTNGFFIDGFVYLTPQDENLPTLHIPYSGFYGDWDKIPLFDTTIYDEGGSTLYIAGDEDARGTFLQSSIDGYSYQLGTNVFTRDEIVDAKYIAISPNGDGYMDDLGFVVSPLRTIGRLWTDFYTETGMGVGSAGVNGGLEKFYENEYSGLNLSNFPDGRYTMTFNGIFRADNDSDQPDDSFTLPLVIDRQVPQVTDVIVDEVSQTLTVSAYDNHYLQAIALRYPDADGEEQVQIYTIDNADETGGEDTQTVQFDIAGVNPADIGIEVYDYAMNVYGGSAIGLSYDAQITAIEFGPAITFSDVMVTVVNQRKDIQQAKPFLAFYDEGGRLLGIASARGYYSQDGELVLLDSDRECMIPMGEWKYVFTIPDSTDAAKRMQIFIWDSMAGLQPLSEKSYYNLN